MIFAKRYLGAAVIAAGIALAGLSVPASAAPVGAAVGITKADTASQVEQVALPPAGIAIATMADTVIGGMATTAIVGPITATTARWSGNLSQHRPALGLG